MVRDGLKTLSFAVLHFAVGFGVTYALTGSVTIATGVALLEPLANTVVFFFHERVWRWFERPDGREGGNSSLARLLPQPGRSRTSRTRRDRSGLRNGLVRNAKSGRMRPRADRLSSA